jgi:hypothetical protein
MIKSSTIAFVNIFANYFLAEVHFGIYYFFYQAMEVKARQICFGIAMGKENKRCSFVHFRKLFVDKQIALASVSEDTYIFGQ